MTKLLIVCVLVLCFTSAFGRKCNVCASSSSLDDCDKNKKEVSCPPGADYCATLSMVFKIPNVGETKSFARSCSTKALCDKASTVLKPCKDAGGECSFKCCDSDFCNGDNAVPNCKTVKRKLIDFVISCIKALFQYFRSYSFRHFSCSLLHTPSFLPPSTRISTYCIYQGTPSNNL
ncbi:uncharacterized protein LOC144642104 isoform X2 [Oculina patagonica]